MDDREYSIIIAIIISVISFTEGLRIGWDFPLGRSLNCVGVFGISLIIFCLVMGDKE